MAVPTSHGLGRTKQPDSCNARNLATASNCASFIHQCYRGKTRSRVRAATSLSNTKRLGAESDRGDKREDDEQGYYHEVSEFKWRLALCRRHRCQRGDFFE